MPPNERTNERPTGRLNEHLFCLSVGQGAVKARAADLKKELANCGKQFGKLEMAEKKVAMEVATLETQLADLQVRPHRTALQ
eukprot:SAG22_NODE_103_length_20175_cov_15.280833_16_plen_82_part_00